MNKEKNSSFLIFLCRKIMLKMSQINLKAKKKEKENMKLYINCKFIGNKPEVK